MQTIKNILNTINEYEFDFEPYRTTMVMRFYEKTRSEETKQAIRESKLGLKQTPEHIQKRVNKMIGFRQSQYQKDRAKETLSCAWIVTNPQGQSFNIVNLNQFCRQNNLDQGNMSRGKHKGWKCIKIES
jgi:hypothetical protein